MHTHEVMSFNYSKYDEQQNATVSAADKALIDFIKVLLANDYTCVLTKDDFDTIYIEYNYASYNDFGSPECFWATPEEIEEIELSRKEKVIKDAARLMENKDMF